MTTGQSLGKDVSGIWAKKLSVVQKSELAMFLNILNYIKEQFEPNTPVFQTESKLV